MPGCYSGRTCLFCWLRRDRSVFSARVMAGEPIFALRFGQRFEGLIYRVCGLHAEDDIDWRRYATAVLACNALSVFAVYARYNACSWCCL